MIAGRMAAVSIVIMMKSMRKCKSCGAYTLDSVHCGAATASPHPPKYSLQDRYAKYRRMEKGLGQ